MSEMTAITILLVLSVIVVASNFFIMTTFLKKLKRIRADFEKSMGIGGETAKQSK